MSFLSKAALAPALVLVLAIASLSTACTATPAPSPDQPPVITPEFFGVTVNAPTPTVEPSVTPVPSPTANTLAATVNDQPITLDQLDAELTRYVLGSPGSPDPQSEQGRQLAAQVRNDVLDALIETALIEQEAATNGVVITDQQVDDEMRVAKERAGGEALYSTWLTTNRLTEQDAREMVRRELLANAIRDRILIQLPRTAEYAHAYHIVVRTQREAEQIEAKLQNGAKFSALAQQSSIDDSTRADGGDLGWIARGSGGVVWSEVDDAIFALQPGQTSPIVQSPIGFHILRVTERETRALTEADAAYLQEQALTQWIAGLKARAKIERFV
jgi:parvulin-like peptidyl-prolyl isomerase